MLRNQTGNTSTLVQEITWCWRGEDTLPQANIDQDEWHHMAPLGRNETNPAQPLFTWAGEIFNFSSYWNISHHLGPFSISLLKLSQLKAKSWSQPSNLLQTGFLSCVQVNDLSEILTWNSS